MFESTDVADRPLLVRASFGQCFKAGAAFTCGALAVTFIASLLYLVVLSRLLPAILLRLAQG